MAGARPGTQLLNANKDLEDDDEQIPMRTEFCQMSGMAVQFASVRIVRMLLTTIDSAFLGHLGTQQLAGVSLSSMWQGVPSSFVQFTISAVATLASQARGAGHNKSVGGWLQTSLLVAMIGCIPVMVIFWNVHYMVALTMDDEATVDYARQFSQMMMWSLPPQFIYSALAGYFSTIDVVLPATFCTCITVIANIVFNYVFIYGVGSWEGFGFVGSPLATVTSSYLQLILFVLYTIVWKGYHREYWGGWDRENIGWARLKPFLQLGVPTGASSVVDWASGAIAGSFAGLCGVEVAAGQNVLNSLFSLSYSTVSGFSTATQIRLARYLGEGKPVAAKRILRIGSATLLTGGVFICLLLSVCHNSVWGIWTKDQKLISSCNTAIVAFMAGIMLAYLRFTLTVVCVSLGPREAWINLVSNNIASWVIYIPLAYVMPLMWGWGLPGFWWSDAAGEAFKVVCLSYAVMKVDWAQASRDAQARQTKGDAPPAPSPTMNKPSLSPMLMTPASPMLAGSAASRASPAPRGVQASQETVRTVRATNGLFGGWFSTTPAADASDVA